MKNDTCGQVEIAKRMFNQLKGGVGRCVGGRSDDRQAAGADALVTTFIYLTNRTR